MLVSQLQATVIYTLLKTFLLILLGRCIASFCAWASEFTYSKIFEQDPYTILFNVMTTRKYKRFWGIKFAGFLLVILILTTTIGFLPTIATNLMPFHAEVVHSKEGYYYKAGLAPLQSREIPTTSYLGMDAYCGGMNLCNSALKYSTDIVTLSPTLQVNAIPFTPLTGVFTTPYGDVNTGYCSPDSNPMCVRTPLSLKAVIAPGTFPGTNLRYVQNYIEADESGFGQTTLRSLVRNFTFSGVPVDMEQVISLAAAPNTMDGLSTSHYSKIIHQGADGIYLLVIKIAVHQIAYENQPYNNNGPPQNHSRNLFSDVFNNTQLMYPIVDKLVSPNATLSLTTPSSLVYTTYQHGDFFALDVVQKSLCYYSTPLMKIRILMSVYHITDSSVNYNNTSPPPPNDFLTQYNRTEFTYSLDAGQVPFRNDPLLNNFNDPPTPDLYMYSLAATGALYGSTGTIVIAADLTLPFLLFTGAICLLMTLIWVVSRAKYNSFYFESLLLVLGGNVTVPSLSIGQNNICVVDMNAVDLDSDQRLINDKYDSINT